MMPVAESEMRSVFGQMETYMDTVNCLRGLTERFIELFQVGGFRASILVMVVFKCLELN